MDSTPPVVPAHRLGLGDIDVMAFNLNRTQAALLSWPFTLSLATALIAGTVTIFLTTGCGNFFVPPTTTSTGSTGTTTTTTDFAYFSNSSSASTTLDGYTVASGVLTAATSSPYALGIVPQSMVVTPPDTYLYIASSPALGTGSIYGFSIGTGGALTVLNGGARLAAENSAAITVSADGNYLFSLNSISLTLEQYSINTSTGFLTSVGNYPISGAADGGTVVASGLKFAPSGDFLVAALGTGGAESFGYNTSTGALASGSSINPGNTAIGIYGVAIDASNNVYTAGTNTTASPGLQVFSATTAGVLTPVSSTNTGTIGNAAHSVVVNAAGTYVYTGNYTDGTISAYSIASSGQLTAVTGSPFAAPTNVTALTRDSTSAYILAAGYSASSGFQVFSITSTGGLTSTSTAASGTSTAVPVAIAATH